MSSYVAKVDLSRRKRRLIILSMASMVMTSSAPLVLLVLFVRLALLLYFAMRCRRAASHLPCEALRLRLACNADPVSRRGSAPNDTIAAPVLFRRGLAQRASPPERETTVGEHCPMFSNASNIWPELAQTPPKSARNARSWTKTWLPEQLKSNAFHSWATLDLTKFVGGNIQGRCRSNFSGNFRVSFSRP